MLPITAIDNPLSLLDSKKSVNALQLWPVLTTIPLPPQIAPSLSSLRRLSRSLPGDKQPDFSHPSLDLYGSLDCSCCLLLLLSFCLCFIQIPLEDFAPLTCNNVSNSKLGLQLMYLSFLTRDVNTNVSPRANSLSPKWRQSDGTDVLL